MVLEKIGASLSWPLRDRGARNTHCALHLSRSVNTNRSNAVASRKLQLNRVAFQFVVEGWSLNPEQFGCFFLVPATFGQSLQNCVPLQVIESLHALVGQRRQFGLLQRWRQLYFCGQFLNADLAGPRQYDGVFDGVLQFANISRPGIIEQLLKCIWGNVWLRLAE